MVLNDGVPKDKDDHDAVERAAMLGFRALNPTVNEKYQELGAGQRSMGPLAWPNFVALLTQSVDRIGDSLE